MILKALAFFGGDRLTEAVHINKSLFALQGVVAALADGNPHVPYRNDPLTQLLRPALGGNCCTTLVATISPAQKRGQTCLRHVILQLCQALQGVRGHPQLRVQLPAD